MQTQFHQEHRFGRCEDATERDPIGILCEVCVAAHECRVERCTTASVVGGWQGGFIARTPENNMSAVGREMPCTTGVFEKSTQARGRVLSLVDAYESAPLVSLKLR